MTQLSPSDREEMRKVAAMALVEEDDAAAGVAFEAAEKVELDSIKDFFCNNWDTIKKVLKYIADQVGGVPGKVIKAIIAAGDFLHGRVCG